MKKTPKIHPNRMGIRSSESFLGSDLMPESVGEIGESGEIGELPGPLVLGFFGGSTGAEEEERKNN